MKFKKKIIDRISKMFCFPFIVSSILCQSTHPFFYNRTVFLALFFSRAFLLLSAKSKTIF